MKGRWNYRWVLLGVIVAVGFVFVGLDRGMNRIGDANMTTLDVTSNSFSDGQRLPVDYTCEGRNISPHLAWGNVPTGTVTFSIICDDPDAPHKPSWVHWVIFNIPASIRELVEGNGTQGDGTMQGSNSWGKMGFGGACPPQGDAPHRYIFKVYALDGKLNLAPGASKIEVEAAMKGHILATGQIMGTYSRG